MREYPHDHDRLFDRGEDLQLTATLTALDFDVEDALLPNDRNWPGTPVQHSATKQPYANSADFTSVSNRGV